MIPGLKAVLENALDGRVEVHDLDTGPDAERPSVWITEGPTTPTGRMVNSRARGSTQTARLVCTSSSALGAGNLSQYVAWTLDGERLNGELLRAVLITEPLEDRTDPTAYRWSASVDVEQTTPRGITP